MSETVSIQTAGARNPTCSLSAGHDLLTAYVGDAHLVESLEANQAKPLSLASADFDEDGVPDLIAGYQSPGGEGIVVLHRGNVDAIYPNSQEARRRRVEGAFTDAPFLSPARVIAAPAGVDFVGAGDFDGDGHADVVTANRSDNHLYLFRGDGRGGLALTRILTLPGRVTALVIGEINRCDGLADVVIGTDGEASAKVLVFEGPEGALWAKPEVIALPQAATSLALGRLVDEQGEDLAIAAGRFLAVVHGRDRKLSLGAEAQAGVAPPVIEKRAFAFAIKALAVGDFDGSHQTGVALLTEQGDVRLLRRGGQGRRLNHWESAEVAAEHWAGATAMMRARVGSSSADDLLVLDSGQRQMHFITNRVVGEATTKSQPATERRTASAEVSSAPVAAIAMNLNGDAMSDIVTLRNGTVIFSVATSAASSVITVNSTLDTNNRDDVLTLREAILVANGQLSVNDLTPAEMAQVSGTPSAPGMDQILFNIAASLSSGKALEAAQPASGSLFSPSPVSVLNRAEPGDVPGPAGITTPSLAAQSISNEWTSHGPFGGRINHLAFDPTNTNTIYAGTVGSGVYKTTNGGGSWNPINQGLASLGVFALAIDPTNPRIIYAGTFDFAGGSVYKTTNGGDSWNAAKSGLGNNGVLSSGVLSLVMDPKHTGTLYAGSHGDGIYKTTNGGASWTPVNSGLGSLKVKALAIDPVNTSTVYAGTEDQGAFKTTDGGASWNPINSGLGPAAVYSFAIDPTNPNTVYAGIYGGGVFKTTSGGSSWNAVNSGLNNLAAFALAIDPNNPSTIYAGTFGDGMQKTTDGGASWNPINSGLGNLFISSVVIDPANPSTIYAGTQDNGAYKTTDGGASWNPINSGLGNVWVLALAIDPTNPGTLYAGTYLSGVFKTTSGGTAWSPINSGLTSVTIRSVVIDLTNTAIVYVGTQNSSVYKTTNGGASWNAANSGLGNRPVLALAIDPFNSSTLYAGTGDAGTVNNGVFKTTDGGASWISVNSGLNDLAINSVTIDPISPGTLYVGTLLDGVYKTTSGGASWAVFGMGLSNTHVYSVVISPPANKIYAGADNGVFGISSSSCSYVLISNTTSFPTSGGSGGVVVNTTSGCNWAASSNANWLTIISGSTGAGTGTLNFAVAPSTESNLRTGSLTIAGQIFMVSQSGTGSDCVVNPIAVGQTLNGSLTNSDCLSPFRARPADRYAFTGTAGQQIAIQLSAAGFDTYLYLVDSSGNIIAQDDDGTGSSNSRIPSVSGFFSLPANDTYRIEVTSSSGNSTGNYTLSLLQGSGTVCTYSISPTSQNFDASGGRGSISVTTPTGCTWTAIANANFISITSLSSDTATFTVAANTSPDPRTGTITIAGQTFTVNQAGTQQCTFAINPQRTILTANGGNGTINVSTQGGCNWTAISNASFIVILSGNAGTGNGQVTYQVLSNPNPEVRSGTLTVAGLTFSVIQQGSRQIKPHTIKLTSPLPKITDSIIIDATTQANTIIEIDASGARGADVLSITAGNSTVRGLVINHFNAANARASGILLITNGNNIVENCLIGTDPVGINAAEGPVGNAALTTGISIRGSNNNRIGGLTVAARNIIAGIDGNGIVISNGASGNRVLGNYIGTDVTGTVSLGNQSSGTYLIETSHNSIGGTEAGASNLISGNLNWGVLVGDSTSENTIQQNIVGLNALGTSKIENGNSGIFLRAANGPATNKNTVGGTTSATRNLISGNDAYGIAIGAGATGTQVQGNYIGTNAAGTGALGNGYGVIVTQANDTTIGGATASAKNIISGNELAGIGIGFLIDSQTGGTGSTIQGNFIGADVNGAALGNKQDGVFVEVNSATHAIVENRVAFNGSNGIRIPNITANSGTPGVQIKIGGNLIYNNARLGIDLGDAGVTENDPRDEDIGANLQQNFPPLSLASALLSRPVAYGDIKPQAVFTITGTFNSTPNSTFTLEFFFGSACSGAGHQFSGGLPVRLDPPLTLTTGSDGNVPYTYSFTVPNDATGGYVNCTATSSTGNTSEFSECLQVGIASSAPTITGIEKSGKNFIVMGAGFVEGAKLLVNGEVKKTRVDSVTSIFSKKGAKAVTYPAHIQVRNPDSSLSNEFIFNLP